MLNNYDKTYANIIFWTENPKMVIDLANIEEGTGESFYSKPVVKVYPFRLTGEPVGSQHTEVLIAGGWSYRNVPSNRHTSMEELLREKMGINNLGNFTKYFTRYVRTWCEKNGFKENFDAYPIPVETFLTICELENTDYNMDKLMEELVSGESKYVGFSDIEKFELKKSSLDANIVKEILAAFPDKLAEYKAGKVNLLNLFFGEYMKKLTDKNVDKNLLRQQLADFLSQQ